MQKSILLFIVSFLFISNNINAQVGIGTNSPNTGAILDLNSTSKALLLPRLTTAERNSISNPAAGMLIFNTDSNKFEGCKNIFGYSLISSDTIPDPSNNYDIVCINNWQTFTVSANSQLKMFRLGIADIGVNPSTNITVQIRNYSTGSVLGSASAIIDNFNNGAVQFDLPSSISLIPGIQYSFYISSLNSLNVVWARSANPSSTSVLCTGSGFGHLYKAFSHIPIGTTWYSF